MKDYGLDLKWLAVSSFELRFGNTTIVTDPYITDCACTDLTYEAVEACDMICITHVHWDHITDIPALAEKFQPKILLGDMSSLPLARWLNYSPTYVYPMYPDTELDFGDFKVRALYGRHIKLGGGINDLVERINTNPIIAKYPGMDDLTEIGSFEYRNYLFTLPNGTRILLWGNDVTPEQTNLCRELKPDIAIIQRSIDEQASYIKAKFVADIGAKVLIPHHHDFRKPEKPEVIEKFRDAFLSLVPDGTFISPAHGEWVHI